MIAFDNLTNENWLLYAFQNYRMKEYTTTREFVSDVNITKYINNDGKRAYIYGASTKGNCILQYCNITESDAKYAVERNKQVNVKKRKK